MVLVGDLQSILPAMNVGTMPKTGLAECFLWEVRENMPSNGFLD